MPLPLISLQALELQAPLVQGAGITGLRGHKIIEVCKELGVDAVHPGYGFLSENSAFAEECEKNNIIFIGPKSKAIEMMGSKLAAKEAVMKYDIPMVPVISCGLRFDLNDDGLRNYAEQKYSNGKPAEGIVIRPLIEQRINGDRLSVKVINLQYRD